MYNKAKSIHFFFIYQNIQLHKLTFLITLELIVKGSITSGSALESIEEVVDDFAERKFIVNFAAVSLKIFGIFINSAAFLAKFHNASDILGGGEDGSADVRFLGGIDYCRVGIVGGVIKFKNAAVVEIKFVNNAGRGCDKIEVIFSFKTLENYFHMEKSEESAAETETESGGSFRLKMEGSVVESELFKSIAEVAVFCAVQRIDTCVNHRVYFFIAGKSFFRRRLC